MLVPATILACLLSAPDAPKAVWVTTGIDGDAAAALAGAVERSTGLQLIDRTAAARELTRLSSTLGPDPAVATQSSLQEARNAFLQLDLRKSVRAYQAALDQSLQDRRRVTDPKALAAIFFERALVALANQKKRAARRDLRAALTLDPTLAPDQDQYGPPVFRALRAARRRQAKAKKVALRIDRAPEDAVIRVNGVLVPAGQPITVKGRGPHLLTAEARGYQPRSSLVELERRRPRVAVVLERGTGALLATQTLAEWQRLGGDALDPKVVDGAFATVIARCLSIPNVVSAQQRDAGELDLALLRSTDGAVVRSVRGRRVEWEPYPYAALTESLEGRTLEPPASPVELTLTVSAPSQVEPSASIPLVVDVRDPARQLAVLEAKCGEQSVAREVGTEGTQTIVIDAPAESTEVECVVTGMNTERATIVTAPPSGPLRIEVTQLEGDPWYSRWYFWGAIGVALAAGAVTTVVATRTEPETQEVLRIHGPR